jgi:hypothetical protein
MNLALITTMTPNGVQSILFRCRSPMNDSFVDILVGPLIVQVTRGQMG